MKTKLGVSCLIASLLLFAAVAYAEQGSMPDQQSGAGGQQQKDQQAAMTQDPQAVKQVQQALSDRGYDPGPADGKWTSKTESALKDFQQAQGMQATGQLDQQTMASLGVMGGAAAGGQQGSMPDQQGGQQGGSRY